MIVLITTRGNGYPLRSIAQGQFGVPTPKLRLTHYERLFGAWRVPRATYLFGDLERLAPWELRLAADLYRTMTDAGLRCLNDPARAMSRIELLTALHAAGINPFTALRADTLPRPERFPVFLRTEEDHARALPELLHDQEQLDRALAALRASGVPLRGMMVVGHAPAPYGANLWAKWGTYRIGEQIVVEHLAVDGTWLVKIGDYAKRDAASDEDERDAVMTNRFAAELKPAFDIAGIAFGRADHGVIGGRRVVYEINTNPYIGPPSKSVVGRVQTNMHARARMAEALATIDTAETGWVRIAASAMRRPSRWWRPGFVTPRRP